MGLSELSQKKFDKIKMRQAVNHLIGKWEKNFHRLGNNDE